MPNRRSEPDPSPALPPLSGMQLEVMQIFWRRQQATVGEVWAELTAQRPCARNTVLTHIDRLEKKGWLRRSGDGPVQQFTPVAGQHSTMGDLARQFVGRVFGGSPSQLMLALLEGETVSKDELERLRVLIQQARRRSS